MEVVERERERQRQRIGWYAVVRDRSRESRALS